MSRSIKRCTHQQNIFSVTDRAATGSGSRRGLARYIKRGNSDFELVFNILYAVVVLYSGKVERKKL